MGEKIVIGPINRGLRTDREPFVIDNDSFPQLVNAYQWRGRVKRKRGTSFLCHLSRSFPTASIGPSSFSGSPTQTWNILNIYSTYTPPFTPEANATIVPGSIVITIATSPPIVLTDLGNGKFSTTNSNVTATINYTNGDIVVTNTGPSIPPTASTASFSYYPNLPVMGLRDLNLSFTEFPGTIAFDTKYSYSISTSLPYASTDVTFYINPQTVPYPSYAAKGASTPFTWNGQNYQQFWTTNYQSAFWATNGIYVPFSGTNTIGMQFLPASGITSATQASSTTVVNFVIPSTPLVVGDFVFANEFTGPSGDTLNFQTGYVIAVSGTTYTVKFPNASIGAAGLVPGILQYLTNSSNPALDCIRFYATIGASTGWVNFCPPLSFGPYSISQENSAKYYLVGARLIVPFKDRLMFFGPVIQTSNSANPPLYLQDTVIYSQNGTPYYTASFTGTPGQLDFAYTPILVPDNEVATPVAFWEDQVGFGGFAQIGIQQAITTVSPNEDTLICGLNNSLQTRFLYTGNDLNPFEFFIVNSELGSASTFSSITMDEGVITRGPRGFIMTSQTNAKRIDLDILPQAFQISNVNNGSERFTAQRDFINEWIYFTYTADTAYNVFPNQTLQYNYRDNSWAIFNESYTTYGQFRKTTGYTWATVGSVYPTWDSWTTPWESGSSQVLQPQVIAGNAQGFILERADGTEEGTSLGIQSFAGNTITSPNHSLNNNDYIVISNATGTVSQYVNGKVFRVFNVTNNTFQISITIPSVTYFGAGLITRLYMPLIQSRQFPVAWGLGRKTRIGVQQYLLTATANSQATLNIYLSQDSSTIYNEDPIVPNPNAQNDALIYSTTLYTSPESTNLGLTPANINLLQLNAVSSNGTSSNNQSQIWHRINTSLIGDTVQFALTLNQYQMQSLTPTNQTATVTGATNLYPSVITAVNSFPVGALVTFTGVQGMTQLNVGSYQVTASNGTTFTIDTDATGYGTYTTGGVATQVAIVNQVAEIELHGAILDVSPSQMLA